MTISAVDPAHLVRRPPRVWDYKRVWESKGKPVEIWLCDPSDQWEHEEDEWSLKCGHKNKANDHWARAGEVPGGQFLLEAVKFAYEEGYYTHEDIGAFVGELFEIEPAAQE